MTVWAIVALAAGANEVAIAPEDGVLRPGVGNTVWIASVDRNGEPQQRRPLVETSLGEIRNAADPPRDGAWPYTLTIPMGSEEVSLTVDGETLAALTVTPLPRSSLVIEDRIEGLAGGLPLSFRVIGEDLVPEALVVAASEGEITSLTQIEGGVEVELTPSPSLYPRAIAIGLWDRRREERPYWTRARLRARPHIPLQTEPGAELRLTVGGREYGPYIADNSGHVEAVVDQYPGELVATAVLRDDVGNETRHTLPLSSHSQPSMLSISTGSIRPGQRLPVTWLRAIHSNGAPWVGREPTCRSPGAEAMEAHAIEPGVWMVPVPPNRQRGALDLQVRCALGSAAEADWRIPAGEEASEIRLRLFPEELTNQNPFAEIRVYIDDGRGEPLPVHGVSVQGLRGRVEMDQSDNGGWVLRGNYLGAEAVEAGEDQLVARFDQALGSGPLRYVEVGHGAIQKSGAVAVYGRALDSNGHPLAHVPLTLAAGSARSEATTGPDGWAEAVLGLPPGAGPVRFLATNGVRSALRVAARGSPRGGGPGSPDLVVQQTISITSGEAAGIAITVDPPVLYLTQGAQATVSASLVDNLGKRVRGSPILLTVTGERGALSEFTVNNEGDIIAVYQPGLPSRAGPVEIAAQTEEHRATAALLLEPRPMMAAISLSAGALSNFGRISSPIFAFGLDYRVRKLLDGRMMVRGDIGLYWDASEVETGFDEPLDVSVGFVPVSTGLLWREDRTGNAFWTGVGLMVAPYRTEIRGLDGVLDAGSGVLPGLWGAVGYGRRVGGGELSAELRGLFLLSSGVNLPYQGNVGGAAALVGYRVVY